MCVMEADYVSYDRCLFTFSVLVFQEEDGIVDCGVSRGSGEGRKRSGVLVSFFFQAEDGIRALVRSRGLGDVYKCQPSLLEWGPIRVLQEVLSLIHS